MNFYIETENGAAKNHPAFEDNLIQAFGEIPTRWEPFIRVERPTPGMYQVLESKEPVYLKIDGVWTDVWSLREMTTEEREAADEEREAARLVYIQEVQSAWAERYQHENWSAWVFNEETIDYDPPIPRPEPDLAKLDVGVRTFWCGADSNWKDTPVRPEGDYKFDFIAWQWVVVTTTL